MNATATDKPTTERWVVTPTLSEPSSNKQPAERVKAFAGARIAVGEWVTEHFIPSITTRTQQQP